MIIICVFVTGPALCVITRQTRIYDFTVCRIFDRIAFVYSVFSTAFNVDFSVHVALLYRINVLMFSCFFVPTFSRRLATIFGRSLLRIRKLFGCNHKTEVTHVHSPARIAATCNNISIFFHVCFYRL